MLAVALWFIAGLAASPDASTAPATTSDAAIPALLVTHEDEGCSGPADAETPVSEFNDGVAVFRQRIWLSLRESVKPGSVALVRDGMHLRAEVETVVAPVEAGASVPACIRPVELVLSVPGLAKGDYELRFVRKPVP